MALLALGGSSYAAPVSDLQASLEDQGLDATVQDSLRTSIEDIGESVKKYGDITKRTSNATDNGPIPSYNRIKYISKLPEEESDSPATYLAKVFTHIQAFYMDPSNANKIKLPRTNQDNNEAWPGLEELIHFKENDLSLQQSKEQENTAPPKTSESNMLITSS